MEPLITTASCQSEIPVRGHITMQKSWCNPVNPFLWWKHYLMSNSGACLQIWVISSGYRILQQGYMSVMAWMNPESSSDASRWKQQPAAMIWISKLCIIKVYPGQYSWFCADSWGFIQWLDLSRPCWHQQIWSESSYDPDVDLCSSAATSCKQHARTVAYSAVIIATIVIMSCERPRHFNLVWF